MDALERQLLELEALEAMFPTELSFRPEGAIEALRSHVEQDNQATEDGEDMMPKAIRVDYQLASLGPRCIVSLTLPRSYPEGSKPISELSAPELGQGARTLQIKIKEHIDSLDEGTECLFDLIEWLREAADRVLKDQKSSKNKPEQDTKKGSGQVQKEEDLMLGFLVVNHLHKGSSHKKEKAIVKELRALCKEHTEHRVHMFYGQPGLLIVQSSPTSFSEIQKFLKKIAGKPAILTKTKTIREKVQDNGSSEKFVEYPGLGGGGCDKDAIRRIKDQYGIKKTLDVILGLNEKRGGMIRGLEKKK
eukprot:jgi/Bigna1/67196/fgenesh1_pg.3_\